MISNQANSPNKEQIKLMKYLDDFDRQINNRKGNIALEQQLASLSKAYNQAQEKLLETEKALMTQSILLEKQRSVIDIYKYALNEELDEQGILYFLQQLEQDQSNQEIYEDIGEIRNIINRKRMKHNRKSTEEQKMAKELKREVARLTDNNSAILEENETITNTVYELRQQNQHLQSSLNTLQAELLNKTQDLSSIQVQLRQETIMNTKLKEEVYSAKMTIQRLKATQGEFIQMKKKWDDIERLLKNKLASGNKQNENKGNNENLPDFLEGLEKKVDQLLKYKSQYKKTKENNELVEFLKKQVTLLKLYLSEESLSLFKEFEQQKLQCIQTQIRNLAVLQKGNFLKLQQCERDVWKYRIQLIKEDDEESLNASVKYLSQTHKSRATFSKSSNMIETIRECNQQQGKGVKYQLGSKISQFRD